jgi:hypothetical protein
MTRETTGNTFPVREALMRLGARYYPEEQTWYVHEDYYAAAVELVRTGIEDKAARRFHPLEEYARPEVPRPRQTVLIVSDDERELCRLEALENEYNREVSGT